MTLVEPGLDQVSVHVLSEPLVSIHREAGDVVLRAVHLQPPALLGAPDWRSGHGRRLIRPFIQLDHLLLRRLSVVDAGVVNLPKTDRAAVWARLSP